MTELTSTAEQTPVEAETKRLEEVEKLRQQALENWRKLGNKAELPESAFARLRRNAEKKFSEAANG